MKIWRNDVFCDTITSNSLKTVHYIQEKLYTTGLDQAVVCQWSVHGDVEGDLLESPSTEYHIYQRAQYEGEKREYLLTETVMVSIV